MIRSQRKNKVRRPSSKKAEHSSQDKSTPSPKKKRKTAAEAKKGKLPVFDLEEPEFPAKAKSAARTSSNADVDAYGELSALQSADAQDKAARKKSLRFHTAKIESGLARRERARAAAGGDDDIPWKERRKEKELRNKKELEKTRGQGGADLDDEEPEVLREKQRYRANSRDFATL